MADPRGPRSLARRPGRLIGNQPPSRHHDQGKAVEEAGPTGSSLPIQRTDLIGRGQDITVVAQLVRANRLTTLTGSGGVGKTRLTLAVAAEPTDGFADGVFFVDLAPVNDGSLIAETAVAACGRSMDGFGASGRSAIDFAAGLLADRHLLVVLDDCDHVIDDAAELADALLASGEGTRVLATQP